MKIAFVIASINSKSNGTGGHYHSLLVTAEQLSNKNDVLLINVGNFPAKALEGTKLKLYSIIEKGFGFVGIHKRLISILKYEMPDILHAFDSSAFYWVRLAGFKLKIPFCITKCGGTNPVYFPFANNLVLFSLENLNFFKSKKKFQKTNLFFIPNRIKAFPDDNYRIDKITKHIGNYSNTFKFLRITRIGNYYHKSSLQLINLVNKLSNDKIRCCVIFIGVVEDNEYLEELKKNGKENCFFFTEPMYTKNAKSLINIADAVMGTGRSFMEAASKEKALFCPVQDSYNPVLITKENFKSAFYYNFSERTIIKDLDDSINYNNIKSLIQNKIKQQEQATFASEIFKEYFDAKMINTKYMEVYMKSKESIASKSIIDWFLHTLFLIRKYYR